MPAGVADRQLRDSEIEPANVSSGSFTPVGSEAPAGGSTTWSGPSALHPIKQTGLDEWRIQGRAKCNVSRHDERLKQLADYSFLRAADGWQRYQCGASRPL